MIVLLIARTRVGQLTSGRETGWGKADLSREARSRLERTIWKVGGEIVGQLVVL